MNKKVASKVAVAVILLIVIMIGGVFWLENKKEEKILQIPIKNVIKTDNKLISSDYGFNFSVPVGWHIWEGNSSVSDLMNKTDFNSILEKGTSALTNQKVKEYQAFMDNWRVESSEVVVFINTETLDYKNRSFADAGKIMSRIVDSEDILKQREVKMGISNTEINLAEASLNNENKEIRTIKIGGQDAQLLISKKMKLVDLVIIKMPIKSNKTISGKKVSSLIFMEYVKKNSQNGADDLNSFILTLGITDGR
jgi:hypothetical protein